MRVFLAVAHAAREGTPEAQAALGALGVRGAPALEAPGLVQKTITVTPETAAEWLTHRNELNRPLRDYLVERYAADMKRGKWRTTHQGIAFGPDGALIDGQHRLAAVVRAEIPVTMLVTYYASTEDAAEAKLKCDTGRSKSMGDVFAMIGLTGRTEGDRVAAVVKGMQAIEGKKNDVLSTDEVRALYLADRGSIDWAITNLPTHDFTAHHRAAFAYAHSAYPREVARFAELIRNVDAPAGSPASAYIKAHVSGQLRTTGGIGRRESTLKILRLLVRPRPHPRLRRRREEARRSDPRRLG